MRPDEPAWVPHRFRGTPRQNGSASGVDIEREQLFRRLAEWWRRETELSSSIEDKVLHGAYQQIIGMGPEAIPLILRELQHRPGHWFWALSAITGEDPIDPKDAGNVRKMAEAWLKWGEEQGYVYDK